MLEKFLLITQQTMATALVRVSIWKVVRDNNYNVVLVYNILLLILADEAPKAKRVCVIEDTELPSPPIYGKSCVMNNTYFLGKLYYTNQPI